MIQDLAQESTCFSISKQDGKDGLLWFIPVLSLTEILFYYVTKICNRGGEIAVLFTLAIIGRLAYIYSLPNPYNLWFVLTAVMFYGFGSLSKNVVINLSKQNLFKVMAASCLFLTASFIYLMSPDLPEFAVNNMASIWFIQQHSAEHCSCVHSPWY